MAVGVRCRSPSSSAVVMPVLLPGVQVWGQRGLASCLPLAEVQLLGKAGRWVLLLVLSTDLL